jgi:hypothetical protein
MLHCPFEYICDFRYSLIKIGLSVVAIRWRVLVLYDTKKFASFPFRNLVERIWISVIRLKKDDEEVVVALRDTQHFVYLATREPAPYRLDKETNCKQTQ